MAAAITSVEHVDGGAWKYTYTGTTPWRRYSPDVTIDASTSTDTTVILAWDDSARIDSFEPPVLYVIDSTEAESDVPVLNYPARSVMQFRPSRDTLLCQVERYNGSAWVLRGTVEATRNGVYLGYLSFQTLPIADEDAALWRVRSYNSKGGEGQILPFTISMVRHRSAPKITTSYDSGTGVLSFTARTV